METKKWITILFILFLFLFAFNTTKTFLSSKSIFGKATADTVSASVTITLNSPPNLTLLEPGSRNFTRGLNIKIKYNVSDDTSVSSIWYNLNNGTNTTLPLPDTGTDVANSFVNLSDDFYVIRIFANDSKNKINDSITKSFMIHQAINKTNVAVDSEGIITFDDEEINEFIKNITGLDTGWTINLTLYNNNTPESFTEPTNLGTTMFFFEINANTPDDTTNTYTLYFNLSTDKLRGVSSNDVRGFYFNNNIWNELTTIVENDAGNPIEFSTTLTHLSQFLVAGKGTTTTDSGTTGPTGEASSGGSRAKTPITPEPLITPEPVTPTPRPEIPKEKEPEFPSTVQELREQTWPNLLIVFLLVLILLFTIEPFKHRKK